LSWCYGQRNMADLEGHSASQTCNKHSLLLCFTTSGN